MPAWAARSRSTLTFSDGEHEESFESGDAFYVAPGHLQTATAGTEYLQFSPTEEMKVVADTMMKTIQRLSNPSLFRLRD